MRILKAEGTNFQSYEHIEFDYSNLGLTLISGETKAGKSTLMDLASWVLFGVTSKESNADDVKSWFAEGATIGKISVDLGSRNLYIVRIRGQRSSDNDLYFGFAEDDDAIRGKDAADTQKIINQHLGTSDELFIMGSYLHQFSRADSFFTAKAKDRREVFEKIVDLSFPISLSERSGEYRKALKKQLETESQSLAKHMGKIEVVEDSIVRLAEQAAAWTETHDELLADNEEKSVNFQKNKAAKLDHLVTTLEKLDKKIVEPAELESRIEQVRQQLRALEQIRTKRREAESKVSEAKAEIRLLKADLNRYKLDGDQCPTCMGPTDNANLKTHLAETEGRLAALESAMAYHQEELAAHEASMAPEQKLKDAFDTLHSHKSINQNNIAEFDKIRTEFTILREATNKFDEEVRRILAETCPYYAQQQKLDTQLIEMIREMDDMKSAIAEQEKRLSALDWLSDKSLEMRGLMLQSAIASINRDTNQSLERFFDADIRVLIVLKDQDKVEFEIQNSGYRCPYKQLSGGERCMLKLAFSLAVMRAAQNTAGVKFSTLMLDESFSGLDAALKVKAFTLLQSLEKEFETILVIDHSEELKSLFDRRFLVTKSGAYSHIEECDKD